MNDAYGEVQPGCGLTFRLDADTKALIATVMPDPAAQAIDEAYLHARLDAEGYAALHYLPDAVTPLLAHYNAGMAFEIKLAECVDASLHLDVSSDGLEAFLDITPAEGGAPVGISMVLAALAENGIGEGILAEAIDAAVAAGVATKVVVARGVPPVHGEDGRFESLIPEVRSRVPRVDEGGHIDYHDLGEILVVHVGDNLMLRHPPTEGKSGLTLFGEKIEANAGQDVMFSADLPGTAYAPDNPNLLQAAITGQPVVVRGGMMVEPLYTVDTVCLASGNIDFDGSVVVTGDVSAGMKVKASGDIQIGGIVDMATLEAGGSVVVKGGVIGSLGRKNVEDQHVHCDGCFNAAYVQQAKIDAGDSIFIDDMAMQSNLTAINHIRVGNEKRGHIVGGHVQAMLSITARVIGSPNRVRTLCEIGVNPLMHKQLLEMSKQRDGKETQLLEVSKLMDFARKNPGKLRPEMIEKARATAALLSADIAAMREEQDGITKKIELSQQSRVNVEQAIYEGVEVHMGSQRFRVTGEHGPCAVGLTPGGLELVTLDGG
ncbi:MAG: FapA family protein [Rhodocyclaceae bacterium]|nr:FapA family protein [Rhodocyclaceae bacterium]MDZ4216542.1 FapA family protein [Rhodocyclaceae bacterium]